MTSTNLNNNKPTPNKSQDKAKPKTHSQDFIPSFIRKTYDILEEAKFPQLIDWSPEGNAIVIKKPSEFSQKVLPTYFKHNNLTSFVRQLNMYNFHKRRSQNLEHVYSHELFQKGKRNLLKEIKRKTHDHTSEKAQKSPESQETPQPDNTAHLVNENQFLKRLYNEAMSRLALLEQQAKDLALQNQALMAQIHNSRSTNPFKPIVASFEEPKDTSSDQVSMTMGKVTLNISSSANNKQQAAAPMNKLFAAPVHNHAQNNVMQFPKQFFTQKGHHGNALTEESSGSTEVSPTSPIMQGRMDHEGNTMERHQLMMMNPMQIPKLRMEADMQALHIPAQFAAHQQVMRMNSNLGISRQEMSVGQLFEAYNSEFQHGEELLCFADQKRDVGKMAMMAGNVLQQTNAIAAAAAAAGNIQAAVFQDKSLLGKRKFDTEAQPAANFTSVQEPTTKRHELSIFSRKGMISTGIEDKEIHEGGAGATADDIDLMNFGNPFLSWPKAS